MIDLYYWPTGNGLKVGILLEELGVEYRLVPVNIREGQQKQESFQRISANGRIPAIVDYRPEVPLSLFESGAILNYRSEERRVGKECRYRWSPYQEKKKKNNVTARTKCCMVGETEQTGEMSIE